MNIIKNIEEAIERYGEVINVIIETSASVSEAYIRGNAVGGIPTANFCAIAWKSRHGRDGTSPGLLMKN